MSHIDDTIIELKKRIAALENQNISLELLDTLIQISSHEPSFSNGFPTLDEIQRRHIQLALEKTGQVVSGKKGAARLLGINPKTLWSRMKKLGMK